VILCGTELWPPSGEGRDHAIGLSVDLGFEGLAIGGWYTRADAIELVAAASASGLNVPVAAAPLLERPLPPGKRLPYLASADDPEERRAAAALIATTLSAAAPLGVRTFTVSLGDVGLGVAPDRLARWFRRSEMEEDEPGGEALAAALAERRARSPGLLDACRAALDLVIPAAERTGTTLAIELAAGPWGLPTPREASALLEEYRQAPIGIVWDQARMSVLARLGAAPSSERADQLATSTRLWRANEAVGIEVGYLPGQGEPANDAAAIRPHDDSTPIVITGRRDSTSDEIRRAVETTRARVRALAAANAAALAAAAEK
jgi:sugar phosphate isomerase/epimerase